MGEHQRTEDQKRKELAISENKNEKKNNKVERLKNKKKPDFRDILQL